VWALVYWLDSNVPRYIYGLPQEQWEDSIQLNVFAMTPYWNIKVLTLCSLVPSSQD